MLRYGHRFSKDIDIFVPDPQSLGFVTPRLSDVAESITTDYVEAAGYVKLYLPEGEIDFVAAPNLTTPGFETETILGHEVRVETSVENLWLTPGNSYFCARRLWDQKAEAVFMKTIGDRYQDVAKSVVSDAITTLDGAMTVAVTDMYLLWTLRHERYLNYAEQKTWLIE